LSESRNAEFTMGRLSLLRAAFVFNLHSIWLLQWPRAHAFQPQPAAPDAYFPSRSNAFSSRFLLLFIILSAQIRASSDRVHKV
jgi:hypothetical protein